VWDFVKPLTFKISLPLPRSNNEPLVFVAYCFALQFGSRKASFERDFFVAAGLITCDKGFSSVSSFFSSSFEILMGATQCEKT
jgi:hypothetical protein